MFYVRNQDSHYWYEVLAFCMNFEAVVSQLPLEIWTLMPYLLMLLLESWMLVCDFIWGNLNIGIDYVVVLSSQL